MLYKTHWVGLSEPSWEREMDLQSSRTHILRYWAGTPDQHSQTNRLYRRMRIGAAQRELSRNNGERVWRPATPAYNAQSGFAATATRCSPREPTFGTRGRRSVEVAWKNQRENGTYLGQFLDDPGPIKLPLPPACYTTSTGAVRGYWCLQVHDARAFPRGIQRYVDESRGTTAVS